jgi:hypothetical protein
MLGGREGGCHSRRQSPASMPRQCIGRSSKWSASCVGGAVGRNDGGGLASSMLGPSVEQKEKGADDHRIPADGLSMTELHGVLGPAIMVLLAVLAAVAAILAVRGHPPTALEVPRRVLLGAIVAQAAIGLALAARGGRPAEGIHWLYGVAIVVALLGPGALRPELSPQKRSGALAVAALLATALAWRLGASG